MDAHTVLLNLCRWTFLTGPFAVGIAGTVRLGNLLWAGNGKGARTASSVAYVFGVGWMATAGLLLFVFRRRVALLIVGSPQTAASGDDDEEEAEVREVVRLVSLLAVPASLFQLFDGLLGVSSSILRGCGRQELLAVVNVVTLGCIGVSGGLIWTFPLKQGCRLRKEI